MLLKSIKLVNFRQFLNEEIAFASGENGKNVTIILGENLSTLPKVQMVKTSPLSLVKMVLEKPHLHRLSSGACMEIRNSPTK